MIGIRPHVYNGFPFIRSLLNCLHPHFCIFGRPSQKYATWGTIGIRPYVYKGFPLFVHFYTVYTPISAELVGPSYFTRHSRVKPLKSMQPEGWSTSGSMFIRDFPSFGSLLHCLHPHFCIFGAQHVSVGTLEWGRTIGIRPHVYKRLPFTGVFPLF